MVIDLAARWQYVFFIMITKETKLFLIKDNNL